MVNSQLDVADRGAEGLADAIELQMMRRDLHALSVSAAVELFDPSIGVDTVAVELALNTMQRRQALLGSLYPYSVRAVGVRHEPSTTPGPYAAMLVLSARDAPFRAAAGDLQDAAARFEALSCVASRELLGTGSVALRFGWPSTEGRPREFPDAIRWIADRMGVPVGSAYRPPRRQDGGVDVVAWRTFGDEQPGFPILLVQCTLERDFVHKSADVDLRVWSGWLAFDTDPMTALAIPYTVASAEDWRAMATRVIVLDRLRLALLIGEEMPGDTAEWVANEIETMRAAG